MLFVSRFNFKIPHRHVIFDSHYCQNKLPDVSFPSDRNRTTDAEDRQQVGNALESAPELLQYEPQKHDPNAN